MRFKGRFLQYNKVIEVYLSCAICENLESKLSKCYSPL